jgi:hypothetical protein
MRRNLDWFNFWLRNAESPGAGREEQYSRWRAIRDTVIARRSAKRTQEP